MSKKQTNCFWSSNISNIIFFLKFHGIQKSPIPTKKQNKKTVIQNGSLSSFVWRILMQMFDSFLHISNIKVDAIHSSTDGMWIKFWKVIREWFSRFSKILYYWIIDVTRRTLQSSKSITNFKKVEYLTFVRLCFLYRSFDQNGVFSGQNVLDISNILKP